MACTDRPLYLAAGLDLITGLTRCRQDAVMGRDAGSTVRDASPFIFCCTFYANIVENYCACPSIQDVWYCLLNYRCIHLRHVFHEETEKQKQDLMGRRTTNDSTDFWERERHTGNRKVDGLQLAPASVI